MSKASTENQDTPATAIARIREENCDPTLFGVYDGYRDIIVMKYDLESETLVNFNIDELRTIRMPQYRNILLRYENIPITNVHFGTVVRKCSDLSLTDLTASPITAELCRKIYVDPETKALPPILLYVPAWPAQQDSLSPSSTVPINAQIISELLENSPIVAICKSFANIEQFSIQTNFKKSIPQVSDTPGAKPDPASGEQLYKLMNYHAHVGYFATWIVERCPAVKKHRSTEKAAEVQSLLNKVYKKWNTKQLTLNTRKYDDYVYDELYKLLWTSRKRPQPLKVAAPNSAHRQLRRVVEIVTAVEEAAGCTNLRHITEASLKENTYQFSFKPASILDIGCADGYVLEALGKAYGLTTEQLVGMDIRPPQSKEIVFIERSALDSTAFEPESFDLITISMTLHHIARWKTVLRNARSWVKPNGYIFVREHDATSNADRLLLDIHDGAFNGSVWENPEQSWESFVAFARSYFFGYATLCLSAAIAGLKLSCAQWDTTDIVNWKTHGMIYTAVFVRTDEPVIPPISGTSQEIEKHAVACTDIVFNVLDPITHPDVLKPGIFTVIAEESSFIAPQLAPLIATIVPNLKYVPFQPSSPLSAQPFIVILEASTTQHYEDIFRSGTDKLPQYVAIYRTREKMDAHKGASLVIEKEIGGAGYKLVNNGLVCHPDFAVACFSRSIDSSSDKMKVLKY